MKNRKFWIVFAVLVLVSLILTACGSANPLASVASESGKLSGFFRGIWDGWTAIWAFVLSLFGGNYNIYEVHNTGNWYNFGYLIGSSLLFGPAATIRVNSRS